MSFASEISSFVDSSMRSVEHDRRAICTGIGDALIEKTPVGDPSLWKTPRLAEYARQHGYVGGHMKANWRTSVGTPNLEERTDHGKPWPGPIDPNGDTAKAEVRENLGEGDVTVCFANNVPYSEKINDGSWSSQAQQGIIPPVEADFENIVAKAVAK